MAELLTVNMGPQHPSTHGVLYLELTMDGEIVVSCKPHLGYLHRSIEKIAENRTYTQFIPYTDRLDYLASMTNNQAYAVAVEKLAGIQVPERAEYLRVIMAELMRISSHLMGVGFLTNDIGAFLTPLLYMYREREKILDLFDMVCGQRLTYNYMRIGGVSQDIPEEFMPALKKFIDTLPKFIEEYEQLLKTNEILLIRNSYVPYYCVPGGYLKAAETPVKAAVRELAEEVSIQVSPEALKLGLEETHTWEGKTDMVSIFDLDVKERPVFRVDNREVIDAEFFSVPCALKLNLFPPLRRHIEAQLAKQG